MNGAGDGVDGSGRDLGELSRWAPELARTFVSLASDIALVIDDIGVIRNVAQGRVEALSPLARGWVGRPWIDTVSGETRPKIANLLKEVASSGLGRRREVNHPVDGDLGVPMAYTAIRLGAGGPVLAVGRDLRAIAAIQQRYVESQQEIERGYWKARQAEVRHDLLLQVATDAVLVVDADGQQVLQANAAAERLYQGDGGPVEGRPASFAFEHHSRRAVNELLAEARRSGRSGEIRARLQGTNAVVSVVAMAFRTPDATRLLVRVRTLGGVEPTGDLADALSRRGHPSRDGVVVTDSGGRIRVANPAFVALARLVSEGELIGQPLMNWVGLAHQPLAELIEQVRRDGVVRQVASWVVRSGGGAAQPVEVSAALLAEGDQECIGFTLHPTGAPADAGLDALAESLHRRLLGLGSQVGVRSRGELLGEAADLAERYFEAIARQHEGDVT